MCVCVADGSSSEVFSLPSVLDRNKDQAAHSSKRQGASSVCSVCVCSDEASDRVWFNLQSDSVH